MSSLSVASANAILADNFAPWVLAIGDRGGGHGC